jgi:hypothetical protein
VIGKNSGWEIGLMSKLKEIQEELRIVFSSQGIKVVDSLVPLLLFLILNLVLDEHIALSLAVGIGFVILFFRLVKRERLRPALTGIIIVVLAYGFILLSGSTAGIFIPGLISGGITVLLCLGSVVIRKPLAAWTSHLTRRWPLEWYWHSRIRPAYSEVTLIWAAAFTLRIALEYWTAIGESISLIGLVKIALGWPYTILVLVASYFYGIWRLGRLGGPSVEEFKNATAPPWKGQNRGF